MMLSSLFVFSAGRALLALLAAVLSCGVAVYGRGYFEGGTEHRFFLFCSACFLMSVWGTLFSAEWLMFLVFMEISTVALFALIAPKEPGVALGYLVVQLAGAALFLAGIGAVEAGHGSAFVGPVPKDALPFFIFGLGVKAALPALHFWLPEVHGRAPAPVSALLSGISVKIGAFGLLEALGVDNSAFMAPVGAVMALWGVLFALAQHDMKRLLAYHTVSQLGYIVAAIGAGSPAGRNGALYHMAAHGLFKGMLFLCAGVIEKVYGTRELNRLGGAARTLPLTFAFFLVSAAAIAGLPGTAGFASKIMVKSALGAHPFVAIALLVANIGTVMSFCKMGCFAFGGEEKSVPRPLPGIRAVNAGMLPLAAPLVLFGIFPEWIPALLGAEGPVFFSFAKCGESLLALLCGGSLFLLFKKKFAKGEKIAPDANILAVKANAAVDKLIAFVRRLQGGNLREYLLATIVSILLLLLLM